MDCRTAHTHTHIYTQAKARGQGLRPAHTLTRKHNNMQAARLPMSELASAFTPLRTRIHLSSKGFYFRVHSFVLS